MSSGTYACYEDVMDEKFVEKIVQKELDDLVEKTKNFPKWKGKRSDVYEAALDFFFDSAKEIFCIYCGCTDKRS